MAMTSQTHSLIPTSTFTSGYSTSTYNPNSSNEADSISDLLSSNGSPPLIVAFLAIGLFVVAMTAVFVWRRITQSRRAYLQPVTTNLRPKPTPPGKRPTLWDVWLDPYVREKSPVRATRWEHTTPLAAIMTFSTLPVGPPVARRPPIGSVDPGGRAFFRTLRYLVSAVKRFHLPAPLPPPPPPPPPAELEKEVEPSESRTSDEMEWGDASSLQVSVIIAMPAQRRCTRRRSSGSSWEDVDLERTALGEFCIGTMDLPWSECV